MSTFDNVSVEKAANVYFDGKVTSRTVYLSNGNKITLGIMQPGEYEFGTAQKEIMDITAGRLDILLSGQDQWQSIQGGTSFTVAANSSFKLKVYELTDYCCSYLD